MLASKGVYWPNSQDIGQKRNILAKINIYWPNFIFIGQNVKLPDSQQLFYTTVHVRRTVVCKGGQVRT